jgi:hypothetical protein
MISLAEGVFAVCPQVAEQRMREAIAEHTVFIGPRKDDDASLHGLQKIRRAENCYVSGFDITVKWLGTFNTMESGIGAMPVTEYPNRS